MSVDVGESAIDGVVANGELFVIDAEEVKKGGVDVVDLSGAITIQGLVAPLIALAGSDSTTDAATAEPVGEDEGIVISTDSALCAGHASKFRRPEDDRILEHAALLQVLDQASGPDGHAAGERAVVALDVLVAVPVAAGKSIVVP